MTKQYKIISITVLFLLVIAITVFALIHHFSKSGLIQVSGILEANNNEVPSLVSGLVDKVYITEGVEVKEGQPILKLNHEQLSIKRQEALAAVKQAEANLEMLKAGASPAEIRQFQAKVNQAHANLQNIKAGAPPEEVAQALTRVQATQSALDLASKEYETQKRLFDQEIISEAKLDEAKLSYNNAKASLKTAQEAYKLVKKGPTSAQINVVKQQWLQSKAALSQTKEGARPAQLKVAYAQIEQAKAEMKLIDQTIKDSSIKAPISGTVNEINVKKGELVTKGTSVVNIIDLDHLWVKIFVPESKLVYLRLDQKATIIPQALPKLPFDGRISFISDSGAFIPPGAKESVDQQVFEVRVSLDKSKFDNKQLRPGMTVSVKIDTNELQEDNL